MQQTRCNIASHPNRLVAEKSSKQRNGEIGRFLATAVRYALTRQVIDASEICVEEEEPLLYEMHNCSTLFIIRSPEQVDALLTLGKHGLTNLCILI